MIRKLLNFFNTPAILIERYIGLIILQKYLIRHQTGKWFMFRDSKNWVIDYAIGYIEGIAFSKLDEFQYDMYKNVLEQANEEKKARNFVSSRINPILLAEIISAILFGILLSYMFG